MVYNSVKKEGNSEVIEKKSRFIGYAAPCESEEQAKEILTSIRKKHFDAGHNVYCYRLGIEKEILKFSDDGEPSGTGGAPIMEIISGEKNNLRNIIVVVTRYFGGTLLGTGGLVRCYGQAAKDAVLSAGIITYSEHTKISVVTSYNLHGKVEYLILQNGGIIETTDFTEQVKIDFFIKKEFCESICKKIVEVTSDNAKINIGEAKFLGV